jgi:MOSC domain-containing protein YiiM
MKVSAICIGNAEKLPAKSFKTGINKQPVSSPVLVDSEGLLGDAVCNRKYHGGPDQAVLLEGSLTLDWWAQQLCRDLPPGTFGENLVIEGLDNRDVNVGDRFCLSGGVILEATMARIPCNTLAVRMQDPKFAKRYTAAARPGIYCRVIASGSVTAGETVRIELYKQETVPIVELMQSFGKTLTTEQRERLLSVPIAQRLQAALGEQAR